MAVEGNAYTNLIKMFRSEGYNKDVEIVVAQVVGTGPIKINVRGLEIEEEDFFKTDTFKKANPAQGDAVLVLVDGSNFFAIDKVVV